MHTLKILVGGIFAGNQTETIAPSVAVSKGDNRKELDNAGLSQNDRLL